MVSCRFLIHQETVNYAIARSPVVLSFYRYFIIVVFKILSCSKEYLRCLCGALKYSTVRNWKKTVFTLIISLSLFGVILNIVWFT